MNLDFEQNFTVSLESTRVSVLVVLNTFSCFLRYTSIIESLQSRFSNNAYDYFKMDP